MTSPEPREDLTALGLEDVPLSVGEDNLEILGSLDEPPPGSLIVRHIGRLTTWTQPVITDAALVARDGRIDWIGPDRELPTDLSDLNGVPEIDVHGAAVMPGFVDSHTHAVWGGDRRAELTARVSGKGYAAGGIMTTVDATRRTSDDDLLSAAVERLSAMRWAGTTTVEIKSGYALDGAGELRLLRIAQDAAAAVGVDAELTYLGAHVVPPDVDREEYVATVVSALRDARVAGAHWCDVFCDEGAFTVDQARIILAAAAYAGLGTRIHAEQLSRTGAASLAAEMKCASADHLEHVDEAGAKAMAHAGVVAVVTPTAALQTRDTGTGHVTRLRSAGCILALATDCNPGTSWCESMPMAIQLACWLWKLPVAEALHAATVGGAAALRRTDIGHLGVGACADFVVLDSDHAADLAIHLSSDPITTTICRGRPAPGVAWDSLG